MSRFAKLMLSVAGLLVGLPALIWACGFIIFTGTVCSMLEPAKTPPVDAIIVLTGGTNRVSRGLDLLSAGKAHDLLISGVHKDVRRTDLVKLWGYKHPLPGCCITLGYEAGNTIGNALEAQKWIAMTGAKSVLLITANYHMPRALLEFRHALPEVTIIPNPIVPENFSPLHPEFWKLAFLEYHKFLLSSVRVMFFPLETTPVPQVLK